MSGIVCAVRGGPNSRAAIARADTLARETGLPLHFLYVVNRDFLPDTGNNRVHTITEQMHWMGKSILLTAQALISAQDAITRGVVRHGDVEDEIAGLCNDVGADYLVVGRPQRAESVFNPARLAQFIAWIEEQTGTTVILPSANDGE